MSFSKSILKVLSICFLLVLFCSSLAACGKSGSPAADSEAAMENFVKKISAGNYVFRAGERLTITAASLEQVYFDYAEEGYEDFGIMTLNGETFQGILGKDSVSDVTFLSTKNALEMAESRLPNAWISAADGNMFNLFYNDPEAPLEFTSYDDTVKMSLLKLMGYGDMALDKMQEVHMILDKEDPSSVHFTAVIEDDPVARIYYDDVDMTMEFGTAKSDPRIDAWLKAPVLPEARTAWSEEDLFFLNSVFLPGYGEDALPFPDFASYALVIDEDVFANENRLLLTDSRASEADVANYEAALLANGFQKAGEGEYRKTLRADYRCFISAEVRFDKGFVLEAGRAYDNPSYNSLAEINELIQKYGFAPLPEDPQLKEWTAVDTASERTESWLYFFEYELSLYITLPYEDREALQTYLDSYGEQLEKLGLQPSYAANGEEEQTLDYYQSADGSVNFRWQDDTGETIVLQFRKEKNLSVEEANRKIAEAGFPPVSFQKDVFCRDLVKYHKMTRGFDGFYLSVSQPFASAEEGEAFLDNYTAALEDAGFYRENPEMIGSLKQNAYYDEENDRYVAFDFFPEEEPVFVNLDFVINK